VITNILASASSTSILHPYSFFYFYRMFVLLLPRAK